MKFIKNNKPKLTIIMLMLMLIVSCDPPRYYNYHVTNSCNEEIMVKIEIKKGRFGYETEPKITKINSNTTELIHSDEHWQPLDSKYVEYFLEKITITKGNDTSKVNYVDKDLWEFKKTSKNHANSYLTVYPEDFE